MVLGDHDRIVVGDLAEDLPTQVGNGLAHVGVGASAVDHVTQRVTEPQSAQGLGGALGVVNAAGGRREQHEDVIGTHERGRRQRRQLR